MEKNGYPNVVEVLKDRLVAESEVGCQIRT